MAALLDANILFGEMLSPEELMKDPYLDAVGLFPAVDHPTEGRIRLIGLLVQSSTRAPG